MVYRFRPSLLLTAWGALTKQFSLGLASLTHAIGRALSSDAKHLLRGNLQAHNPEPINKGSRFFAAVSCLLISEKCGFWMVLATRLSGETLYVSHVTASIVHRKGAAKDENPAPDPASRPRKNNFRRCKVPNVLKINVDEVTTGKYSK